MNSLIVGVIAGAIGMGYFIYGKRQTRIVPMVAGALLCVYPYFVDNLLWLSLIGLVLVVAPFVIDA
jgi:predicted cobalt transporter CbtA